jgi:membrane protein implicated in regulation of membrane protease activity
MCAFSRHNAASLTHFTPFREFRKLIFFDNLAGMPYSTSMIWWIWILVGLGLLVVELFVPTGFFIFLIGIGAIATGLLAAVGLAGPPWLHWFLLVAISSVLLAFVRKYMLGREATTSGRDSDRGPEGKEVEITSEIASGAVGEGQLRGSVWRVRNECLDTLTPGTRCLVAAVEGITLVVRSRI